VSHPGLDLDTLGLKVQVNAWLDASARRTGSRMRSLGGPLRNRTEAADTPCDTGRRICWDRQGLSDDGRRGENTAARRGHVSWTLVN